MFEVKLTDTTQSKQDDNKPLREKCLEETQPDVQDETNDYLLDQYKTKRHIKPLEKFDYAYMMAISLVVVDEVLDDKTKSYKVAMDI